jgi:chromosome segregation ATPase
MFITRTLFRWGLIGGLALGGATLLLGPDRVAAGFSMIRGKAQNIVDRAVSDPVAMRRQLEGLAKQYPDRIAEVRGELAQVDHQISQYAHDIEIAKRVVAMTTHDLGQLKTLVARAEESAQSTARPVAIRFSGAKFNVEEAYNEARRLNNVRGTYQDRLASDQQQLTFLQQQKDRLNDILGKLESEFSTFQAQLWQLDRQIDAIERNGRLIELTEQQQATLASYEKFGKVGSLKQLEAKLAQLRTVQEAQLQSLSKKGVSTDYEKRAEYELSTQGRSDDPFADAPAQPQDDDYIIEPKPASKSNVKSLAFAEPVVIE